MKKMYTKLFIMVLVCSIVTIIFYFLPSIPETTDNHAFFLSQYVFDQADAARNSPAAGEYLIFAGIGAVIIDLFLIIVIALIFFLLPILMVILQLIARLFQIGVEKDWKNNDSKICTYCTIAFQVQLCAALLFSCFSNYLMLIPFLLNVASVVIITKQIKTLNNTVKSDYEYEQKKKIWSEFILFITALLLTFLFNKFVGLVLAIISLVIGISERKNKNVLTIVSLIGSSLLIVYIIVSLIISVNDRFDPVQENANSQNVSDVSDINKEYFLDRSIGYKDFSEEISEDNIDEYTEIIHYIDDRVGIENYYIYDLYYVDYTGSYVIKIVLNEYYDEYRSWYKDDSSNKYIIMFSKKSNGNIEDYYDSFILGMEYEEELLNELNRISPDYQYSVEYNTFLEYSSAPFTGKTLDEAVDYMKSKDTMYLPSLNIFVPADFSEEDSMNLFKNNKTLFEKYALGNITICIMEDSELLDTLDFTDGSISKFNSGVAQYYSYSIDYK